MAKIADLWEEYLSFKEEYEFRKKVLDTLLSDIETISKYLGKDKVKQYKKEYQENLLKREEANTPAWYPEITEYIRWSEKTKHLKKLEKKMLAIRLKIVKDYCKKHKKGDTWAKVTAMILRKYTNRMAKKGDPYYLWRKEQEKEKRKSYMKYHKKLKLNYHYCILCGAKKELHQHHIEPLNDLKKHNTPENVVWLCKKCHFEKAHFHANFSHYQPTIVKIDKKWRIISKEKPEYTRLIKLLKAKNPYLIGNKNKR